MFDAKRLLGELLSGHGGRHSGYGRHDDERYDRDDRRGGYDRDDRRRGYDRHGGSSSLSDLARGLGGGGSGALVGRLASALLGSKKGRRLGGSATKLGGLAMVGSLAYRAYQDWQAGQAARAGGSGGFASGPGSSGGFASGAGSSPFALGGSAGPSGPASPPVGTPFHPTSEPEQQDLSRALLRAMIAAAKADGRVDSTEQANIFSVIDKLDLTADEKAFVTDELRAPLDLDAVAGAARGPEEAAEIYTASLLAIDVDNAAERAYLALLAARLNLDEALVQHLHRTVEDTGQTP